MQEKNAPTYEDLRSPAIDLSPAIGEVAVFAYEESTQPGPVIRFESSL